jgi:hypothetical protein
MICDGALNTPSGRVLFTAPTWTGEPGEAAVQIARMRAPGRPVLDEVG